MKLVWTTPLRRCLSAWQKQTNALLDLIRMLLWTNVNVSVSYRYFGEDVEDEWQNRHICAYPLASEAFGQVFRHGDHASRDVHRDKYPAQSHQHPWCLQRHGQVKIIPFLQCLLFYSFYSKSIRKIMCTVTHMMFSVWLLWTCSPFIVLFCQGQLKGRKPVFPFFSNIFSLKGKNSGVLTSKDPCLWYVCVWCMCSVFGLSCLTSLFYTSMFWSSPVVVLCPSVFVLCLLLAFHQDISVWEIALFHIIWFDSIVVFVFYILYFCKVLTLLYQLVVIWYHTNQLN